MKNFIIKIHEGGRVMHVPALKCETDGTVMSIIGESGDPILTFPVNRLVWIADEDVIALADAES